MEKPIVCGPVDGNIFSVIGATAKGLRKAGQGAKVTEMQNKVMSAESYEKALAICMEYVDFEL